ncbi:hypothetical protein FKR81_17445 [Lentzea tibetensis]|uniref:DUF7847 domain-containing protein n=1 Tax=Lentzea tibetensis TaxID=2591470 RepID=A0A563ETF6_9PSEU|nr:hypothetical protein [Lentzea tibetensis]TWP50872.1 hypothetical protein FKR81_17445 [Lentzea tibetensis]
MSETPEWSSPDQRPQQENNPAPPPPPQYGQQQYGQPYHQPPQAPKPGIIPLRPLGVGEVLDGAITTMRRYPKAVLGVSAVVVAITQLITVLVVWPLINDINNLASVDPNDLTPSQAREMAIDVIYSGLVGGGVSLLVQLVAQTFLSGYVTVVVGRAVLGQPISFREAWDEFRPRLLSLLGATALITLMLLTGVALCVLLGVLFVPLSIPLFILSALLGVALIIWLMVMFSLVTPALVLERGPIVESFRRSRLLVQDAWWRTFGILLLALLIGSMINNIIGLPFSLLGTDFSAIMAGKPATTSFGALLLTAVGGTIAGTITYPFSSAVTVLLYVDRRIRREGMDIELARAAGLTGGQ